MVQAHLGADAIVGQVRRNPGNYSLSTNSLIKLKQHGAPEKGIAAMRGEESRSGRRSECSHVDEDLDSARKGELRSRT